MTGNIEPDAPFVEGVNPDITNERDELQYLRRETETLQKIIRAERKENDTLRVENNKLRMDNTQLKKENNQLKRLPLFVAVVLEKLANNEVYLRQMGNNQEYVTQTTASVYDRIKSGTKVAVNNTLSIVKIMGDSVDVRVKVMEVEEKPETSFEDIGGLKDEIIEVREAVEYPLTKPDAFEKFGVVPPKGVLLYGPPGTGKTLIAKAVAHNAGATPALCAVPPRIAHGGFTAGYSRFAIQFQTFPKSSTLTSSPSFCADL